MSSVRRIAASRANGARSRGPVTRAGKDRSSLNAVRHGLLAKCVVLDNESRDGFDALLADFISRFGPVDSVELGMVEEMLSAFWRQRRVWAIETQVMEAAISQEPADKDELARITGAFTAESVRPQLELMHRYETRLHRMFQRALNNFILLRSLPAPPDPVEPASDSPSENTPHEESLPVGHALACPDENSPDEESLDPPIEPPSAFPLYRPPQQERLPVGHALACPDENTPDKESLDPPIDPPSAFPFDNPPQQERLPVGHALACPDENTPDEESRDYPMNPPSASPVKNQPPEQSFSHPPHPPTYAPGENIAVPNEPNPISGHLKATGPRAAPLPAADQKSSMMPAAGSTGNMLLNER